MKQRPVRDSWNWREAVRNPLVGASVAALFVLALLLPIWWQTTEWYAAQLLDSIRSEIAVDVSLLDNALSSVLNRRFARLQSLHAFVQAELNSGQNLLNPETWEIFAADLYVGSQGIRHLAIAPEGVMRYVYPLAGNEQVVGYEPLADARRSVRSDAQRAIDTGNTILSGPIELVQGGLGLIARQAVYDNSTFWGYVNVALDWESLLAEAGLLEGESDLVVALRDGSGGIVFGNGQVFEQDPVISRVPLPEGSWELAGAPVDGWRSRLRGPLRVFQISGLVIISLLSGLAFLSVDHQARLVLAVRQRTQELQEDVDERRRVEAVLREREEQYRGIFEATSDGLFISDLEGRLVDFNPAAARMHGYTTLAFRELQPAKFIHTDSLPMYAEFLETVKRGERFEGRAVDVKQDGTRFSVAVIGAGFTYRGKPHALALVRDITQDVQAYDLLEQRVALRTRELTALLELSNDLAMILDLEPMLEMVLSQLGRVITYSSASVLIIGNDRLRVIGHRGQFPKETITQVSFSKEQMGELWTRMLRPEPIIIQDINHETPRTHALKKALEPFGDMFFKGVRSWLGVPLIVQERVIGWVSIEQVEPNAYTERDGVIGLAIAHQAAIAIENARLYAQARRLAALEERQRLARELHDSVSQVLYGIGLNARAARILLDQDPSKATQPLDDVLSLAEAGLAEMRALIFELRPDSLEKEGIIAALNRQVASISTRYRLEVKTAFSEEPSLPFEVKEALFRIAQEALNNTVRHAQASRVELTLHADDQAVILEIRDNGIGFDPQAGFPGHLGLLSMRERASQLGGIVKIVSTSDAGTAVSARIPIRAKSIVQSV